MSALQSIVEDLATRPSEDLDERRRPPSEREEAEEFANELVKKHGSVKAAVAAVSKALHPKPKKEGGGLISANKALRVLDALKIMAKRRKESLNESEYDDALADFTAEVQRRAREGMNKPEDEDLDLSQRRRGLDDASGMLDTPDQLWESINAQTPGMLVEAKGYSRARASKILKKAMADAKKKGLEGVYELLRDGKMAPKYMKMIGDLFDRAKKSPRFSSTSDDEIDRQIAHMLQLNVSKAGSGVRESVAVPNLFVEAKLKWTKRKEFEDFKGNAKLAKAYGEYVYALAYGDKAMEKKANATLTKAEFNQWGIKLDTWPAAKKRFKELGGKTESMDTPGGLIEGKKEEDENRRHGGLGKLDTPDALFESCLGQGTLTPFDEARERKAVKDWREAVDAFKGLLAVVDKGIESGWGRKGKEVWEPRLQEMVKDASEALAGVKAKDRKKTDASYGITGNVGGLVDLQRSLKRAASLGIQQAKHHREEHAIFWSNMPSGPRSRVMKLNAKTLKRGASAVRF